MSWHEFPDHQYHEELESAFAELEESHKNLKKIIKKVFKDYEEIFVCNKQTKVNIFSF